MIWQRSSPLLERLYHIRPLVTRHIRTQPTVEAGQLHENGDQNSHLPSMGLATPREVRGGGQEKLTIILNVYSLWNI